MTATLERSAPANSAHPMRWRRHTAWAALALVGVAVASATALSVAWGSLALGPLLCLAICPVMLLFMWLADPVAGTDDSGGKS